MDENYHKQLIAKGEAYYAIARDLENEASKLQSIAEFMARRGDKISEQASQYQSTGKLPEGD
jgi:hypothetical protein